MKTKKIIGILLVACMAISMLAACAAPSRAPAAAPAGTGPFAEHLTINWWRSGGSGAAAYTTEFMRWMEERYNITIVTSNNTAENDEQMNLLLATGEMPDFGGFYTTKEFMEQHGLVRSFPRSFIYDFAPDYAAVLDADPYGWVINDVIGGSEDEQITIRFYNKYLQGLYWFNLFRLDWLENVGVAPKGSLVELDDRMYFTESAYTLDEFTDIMDKFRNDDPDKNGQKDTWGISHGPYLHYSYYGLIGAFGVGGIAWGEETILENGRIIPVHISDAYKEFLKYISGLANRGLIDPESATQGLWDAWEKYAAGNHGWQALLRDYVDVRYNNRPPYSILAADPDAKLLITPPVIGPDGKQMAPVAADQGYGAPVFYFGKNASDAVVERILRILDSTVNDPETWVKFSIGYEGLDFKWEGEPWNSACEFLVIEDEEASLQRGARSFNLGIITNEMSKFMQPGGVQILSDFAMSPAGKKMGVYSSYSGDVNDDFVEEKQHFSDFYKADYDPVLAKFFADAVLGMDIDANWDKYIADLKKAGLDYLMELIQKYPTYEETFGKLN